MFLSKPLVPISLLNLDEEPKQLRKRYTICVIEQVDRAPRRDGTVLLIPEDGPCENPMEHLIPLLDGMSDQLEPEQQERVLKYQRIFALSNGELRYTTLVQHSVDTGDSRPIEQPPCRMPLPQREIAD